MTMLSLAIGDNFRFSSICFVKFLFPSEGASFSSIRPLSRERVNRLFVEVSLYCFRRGFLGLRSRGVKQSFFEWWRPINCLDERNSD